MSRPRSMYLTDKGKYPMNRSDPLKNQTGTAAIETAVILMVLLILLFGMIEFGLLFFNRHMLTNAAREGARAGIVIGLDRGSEVHISTGTYVANDFCADHLVSFGNGGALTLSGSSSGNNPGDNLTITLTYDYEFLFLSALGIGPIQLQAVSIMKLE